MILNIYPLYLLHTIKENKNLEIMKASVSFTNNMGDEGNNHVDLIFKGSTLNAAYDLMESFNSFLRRYQLENWNSEDIECADCPSDNDYDMEVTEGYSHRRGITNKKQFTKEFRAIVREWKKSLK